MHEWESIYHKKQQLNKFPYTEVVAFCMKRWAHTGAEGLDALDVGCGSGVHSKFLSELGFNVIGFDNSPSGIENAIKLFPDDKIEYLISDLDTFKADKASFDMVLDRLSTSHSSLKTTKDFYQNLKTSLKENGQVFWQGFCFDNSGKEFAQHEQDGRWNDFSGGFFETLGQAVFYELKDIEEIFAGYKIDSIKCLSEFDLDTKYNHNFWSVDLTYV